MAMGGPRVSHGWAMHARRMGSAWSKKKNLSKYLQPRRAGVAREAGGRRPDVALVERAAGGPRMDHACLYARIPFSRLDIIVHCPWQKKGPFFVGMQIIIIIKFYSFAKLFILN